MAWQRSSSGRNVAFDKKRTARDTPSPAYKAELDSPIQPLRHWRHCIVVDPGIIEWSGRDPLFDELVEKYVDYLDNSSVPRVNPECSA